MLCHVSSCSLSKLFWHQIGYKYCCVLFKLSLTWLNENYAYSIIHCWPPIRCDTGRLMHGLMFQYKAIGEKSIIHCKSCAKNYLRIYRKIMSSFKHIIVICFAQKETRNKELDICARIEYQTGFQGKSWKF